MKENEMRHRQCPFKQGNCQGSGCMAAKTSGFNLAGNWSCSLIPKDSITEAINSVESPQIPEGDLIREIKND